jgi:hypothetical protein
MQLDKEVSWCGALDSNLEGEFEDLRTGHV